MQCSSIYLKSYKNSENISDFFDHPFIHYVNDNDILINIIHRVTLFSLLLLFADMDIVGNWDESVAYCDYAMSQLEQKVKSLSSSLEELEEMVKESNESNNQQLKKYEEFYHSFQEAYDNMYFFVYLGHFLRSNHYDKKQTVLENHKKLLVPYYSIYQ